MEKKDRKDIRCGVYKGILGKAQMPSVGDRKMVVRFFAKKKTGRKVMIEKTDPGCGLRHAVLWEITVLEKDKRGHILMFQKS